MNQTAQLAIVYAIVAIAALYALWRFVPGLKPRVAGPLVRALKRCGVVSDARAEQLTAKLSAASGCGSCDSCGACGPKKLTPPPR